MDLVSGEIIAIDKPLGWTSFDAVKRIRGAIQKRLHLKRFKVGHAGTLDPLASGVLLVCTGRATRRIEELQAGEKEYVASLKLGATTPSFDLETQIDAEFPTEHIDEELVKSIPKDFTGQIMQVPPIYSAVKVEGKRAYKYARKGDDLKLKPKPVFIREIEFISLKDNVLTFRVVCSKGTYIRSLARDIGEKLGSGAHLVALKRSKVGNFSIENCLSIQQAVDLVSNAPLSFPDYFKIDNNSSQSE